MNLFSLIPLSAFLINLYTWAKVHSLRVQTPVTRSFSWLLVSLCVAPLMDFLQWSPVPDPWQVSILRLQPANFILLAFLSLRFVYVLLERKRDPIYFGFLTLAVIGGSLALATPWICTGYEHTYWGVSEITGPLFLPATAVTVGAPLMFGIGLVVVQYRKTKVDKQRKQLGLLVVGAIVATALGLSSDVLFPLLLDESAFPRMSASITVVFTLAFNRAVVGYQFLSVSLEEAALQVFEQASDGVLLLDGTGHVVQANQAAKNLFAIDEPDGLDKQMADLLGERDNQKKGGRFEIAVERNGESRTLSVSCSSIVKASEDVGTLVIVRDLSERKKSKQERQVLIEQLRQSQKMEALGRLAGGVAHDFNNVLSAIMGYAGLLKEFKGETHELVSNVTEIEKAARRAANLTRQLLAFSRKEIILPSVISMTKVVTDMDNMLQRIIGEDVALQTRLDPDLWLVKADRGQLEQVIINLVVNARDAMPVGGNLTITTSNLEAADAILTLGPEAMPVSYVRITVADNGVGMPSDVIDHVFEPFFTTKQAGKGTGLGLSTVYGIVKQAGGTIQVRSQAGKGTSFDLFFPVFTRSGEEEKKKREVPDTRQADETVLVVEDDKSVRDMVFKVMREQGYMVLVARDGKKAVDLVGQYDGDIHLLLTDVVMPEMSGKELADRVAKMRPEIHILFMSGYTDDVIAPHGVLVEGVRLLQKPFEPEELLAAARSALEGS